MLERYLQERKKPLAQLALDTLLELAPDHPRRAEYQRWVRELDQDIARHQQLETQYQAGREALHLGDLDGARRALDALRKIDPAARQTEELGEELGRIEHGLSLEEDLQRRKDEIDALLAQGAIDEARRRVDALRALPHVSKVTIDFLLRGIDEARVRHTEDQEIRGYERTLREHLTRNDHGAARDVAKAIGKRFPNRSRAAELMREIDEHEQALRRQASLQQGLAAIETFIQDGQRQQAELALRVLERLDLDRKQLQLLERRVRRL